MFKHILICTDGSRLAAKGIKAGVKLAKALGAKVSGLYVVPPWSVPIYGEGMTYGVPRSPHQYKTAMEKDGRKVLAILEIEAETSGVPCTVQVVTADAPWQGIVRAVKSKRCDAIVMASHGRGGLGGLVLGSETTRVLAHSKLPVLVIR